MRLSRSLLLPPKEGQVHLFWKCHDSKYLLEDSNDKKMLFKSLTFGLKHRSVDGSVSLHGFCIMDNHAHFQVGYKNGLNKLSSYMRISHGVFGRRYNDAHERSGKVANERPKTPLIGDKNAQMRAHVYIESNPLRTRAITKNQLKLMWWSSYRYFAYGIVDEYTQHITDPDWYLELGKKPEIRQKKYRKFFDEEVERLGGTLNENALEFFQRFIGGPHWVLTQTAALQARVLKKTIAVEDSVEENHKTEQ